MRKSTHYDERLDETFDLNPGILKRITKGKKEGILISLSY